MTADVLGYSERLKALIGSESLRSFGERTGVKPTTLQNQLKGAVPGIDSAAKIAAATDTSLHWLITGEGEQGGEVDQTLRSFMTTKAQTASEFAYIPRLDVKAAAGSGALAETEEVSEFLAFRAEWLRRVGINPNAARVLTAKGDSMEPTIRDGDILLLDTSINRIVDNAIYVVVYSGLVLLKRVQVKLDGSVVLSSDNTAVYDPEVVPSGEVEGLHIAARLMWFGRSI